jgi:site-specific DNA-methyltransferase (adenine-specific)
MDMKENQIIQGDCLEVMKEIPDNSIDMILCDLPYGTTSCHWDTIIPFEPLWEQYKRIIKDNGAIVLTASQPFTSALVMSNVKMFKYEWIWKKSQPSGALTAKKRPMKYHENILVFYKNMPVYNYQLTVGKKNHWDKRDKVKSELYGGYIGATVNKMGNNKYPSSIQEFNCQDRAKLSHPTQKPVALFEYLQLTYTNEGDTILDNCSGSGTSAVAADNIGRNWICIEKDPSYVAISKKRINENRIRLNSNLLKKFDLPLLD